MRVTVRRGDIFSVLSRIQGITGRKTNLAITTNVLLRTTDTGLCLSATDLETGFEGNYPAKVEAHGTVAINSRKLFEIFKDFPSDSTGSSIKNPGGSVAISNKTFPGSLK